MKGKKNLERAIVLGLILSTGVYCSALAAEGPINDDNWKSYENKSYNSEALIENNSGTEAAIKLENADDVTIKITTNGKYDITLNSEGSGIRTQEDSTGGSITLNAGKDNYIKFSGEGNGIDADSNLTITLKAVGNNKILSAENAGEDGVNLGEYQSEKIQFTAGNSNVIKVTHDGIYTNEDSTADSEYIAESGNNEIESGNNGIDHRGRGDIILKAKKGANIITAGTAKEVSNGSNQGDGIRIAGGGNVYLTGAYNNIKGFDEGIYVHESVVEKEIMLTATAADEDGYGNIVIGEDNGIQLDGAGKVNVLAQAGKNYIKGEKVAVYNNGSGTITIQAGQIDEDGVSTFADYEGVDNILTAGENGVRSDGTGTTNVIAANDNIIAGTTNGILSDGAGIIKITAGNDNHIGQYTYTDENGENHTVTSQSGIEITKGSVNITAGYTNDIKAINHGINIIGENSSITMNGADNILTVDSNNGAGYGISASNGANVVMNSTGGNNAENGDISINVSTKLSDSNTSVDFYGVKGTSSSNIELTASKNITIKMNVNDEKPSTSGRYTGGLVMENQSTANVNAGGYFYLESTTNKAGTNDAYAITQNYGLRAVQGSDINITTSGKYITKENIDLGAVIVAKGRHSEAVSVENSNLEMNINGGGIYILNEAQDNAIALHNKDSEKVDIVANGDIYIRSVNNSPAAEHQNSTNTKGILSESYTNNNMITKISGNNMLIESIANGENTAGNTAFGIYAKNSRNGNHLVDIDVDSLSIIARSDATAGTNSSYGINAESSQVDIDAKGSTNINAQYGIYAKHQISNKDIGANVDINAKLSNYITAEAIGVYSAGVKTVVNLTGQNNIINAVTGVNAATAGSILLKADTTNHITSTGSGISSSGRDSNINLEAKNNSVYAGEIVRVSDEFGNFDYYGQKKVINALSGSDVTLTADKTNGMNYLLGAVYASGNVDEGDNIKATKVDLTGKDNIILSNAEITNAGGRTDNVISALYAQDKAIVNVSGTNNIQTYYSDPNDTSTTERVVWAYQGADINITGNTNISTSQYSVSPNNMDIAIVAGTAKELTKADFDETVLRDLDIANVDLKYENNNGANSSITGDILSAYGGVVNIAPNSTNTRAASDAGINITGNLLAGNNGVVDIDLGKGGSLTGRADDYGDAEVDGTNHGAGIENGGFFNPAFSSEIIKGGTVNLTMGGGSRWNVTGQSWITSLTTTGNAEDTLISLEKAKEDLNSNASALTIGTLKGDTRFYMNLNGDRSASDMLYIKNAQGIDGGTAHYNIYLQDDVTSAEINSDGTKAFNGLRFATVGTGSNVDFTVKSQGTGSAFDVEYEVDTDSYVNNSENSDYNSTIGGDANVEKPGDDSVNDFFGVSDNNGAEVAVSNDIMLLDETTDESPELDEVTNFKIVKRLGEELNDTGKTIINMSRANYSNAIYMDRLNKRLGEARYINSEEDEGMWVRIRHDRIGKDDAYRSQNTMYELGYDQKQECDNGERRVGMAIDYMHGDTGYDQIAGKGEIDRYGLWLYDTWMGDKGHYADYVAKWGHLSNDFEVYTMQNGDKVTGDYSNNVFSVSAEYGRKKDIGNDWYFEPQVQAQLARVTGADYTTNQGTKVSVDGINSLIGRAGFRLGKDFGEEKQSTVYIKADVLHEFLGDQDVRVLDKSSDNKWAGISYENEGTWYDVGFGFATQMSKNSYAFMDFEKSFGNDNDETYQINVGMQWSF